MIETENLPEFSDFGHIYRVSREMIISLKIDGTNSQIFIDDEDKLFVGSRNKWITTQTDNAGFANWVQNNEQELRGLGRGHHFGEWCCGNIQRGYGIKEKRFYLFNTSRWIKSEEFRENDKQEICPSICCVVPVLYKGIFDTNVIDKILAELEQNGRPEFPDWPGSKHEGVVVFCVQSEYLFKKTLGGDGHKGNK